MRIVRRGYTMHRSRPIRFLLLKNFLLASLLPTLVLSIALCAIGFQMMVEQAVHKSLAALELAAATVETHIDTIVSTAIMLPALGGTTSQLSSDSLYSLLLDCKSSSVLPLPPERLADLRLMHASLYRSQLVYNPYINGIHIVMEHGAVFSFGGSVTMSSELKARLRSISTDSAPCFVPALLEESYVGLNQVMTGAPKHSCMSYISEISMHDGSGRLAIILIDTNSRLFEPLTGLAQTSDAQVYAVTDDGEIIFSSNSKPLNTIPSSGIGHARYDIRTGRIIARCPLDGANGVYLLYTAFMHPLDVLEPPLIASLSICIMALAYAIIVAVRNSNRFARPITQLCSVMHSEIELPRSIAPYYGISEICALYMRYNEMLDSISRYINQKYESELALERMKMKAMEAQMDSHFLYNTLECIYSMALLSNADDVARVTKSLSDTLRYISRSQSPTATVKQEIAHVQDYVTIQRARLGDSVNCMISVEPAIMEHQMLKLTLQPLVENAFKHGLVSNGMHRSKNVYLSGKFESGALIFTVCDDGIGMDAERLRQVRSGMLDGKSNENGVGIANISSRIQLYYGAAASLTIESTPMRGTTVTLRIPEGEV